MEKLSNDDDPCCIVCFNENVSDLYRLYCGQCNKCIICKLCYKKIVDYKLVINCPKCRKQILFNKNKTKSITETLIKTILLSMLTYTIFIKYVSHLINDWKSNINKFYEFYIWLSLIFAALIVTVKWFISALLNSNKNYIFICKGSFIFTVYDFLEAFVNFTLCYFAFFEIINFIQEILIDIVKYQLSSYENYDFFESVFRLYLVIYYDFVIMNYGTSLMIFIIRSKLNFFNEVDINLIKYPTNRSLIKLSKN